MKKIVISGMTPTGTLTIGNYIGVIKNLVKMQDEYELIIFVADLHALTIDITKSELEKNRKNLMALLIASGIDYKKTKLFFQSDVNLHGELSWILENLTTIGELSRMTQFKDKSKSNIESNGTSKIKTGVLTYPALMASDILLYGADFVVIGNDQKQHLELVRNIVLRFNNKYGNVFKKPDGIIAEEGNRILSLNDSSKKMSKSSTIKKSYISLLDDPDVAYKKIMQAPTDSENRIYYAAEKHNINNLIAIYVGLTELSTKEVLEKFLDKNYGEFKTELASVVKTFLEKLQIAFAISLKEIDMIRNYNLPSIKKMAKSNLEKIKSIIGL